MHIYLPENLVLEEIEGYKEKHKEKYQWFVHTIIHQSYKTEDGFGGYINLQQKFLRRFIGERYCKQIIRQLKNSRVIEVNGKYSTGKFSMSYRLTEKYKEAKIISVDFNSSSACKYLEKLVIYNKISIEKHLKKRVLNQLHKNVLEVEIDAEAAMDYLNKRLASNEISQEQWNYGKISIESIEGKDERFFFKVDENTGRVYHSIANCPRYLRQFLSHKGQRLKQIDIANSQPMLFSKMLIDYCNTVVSQNNKYTTDISTIITPYVETVAYSVMPADVNRYINLCSEGRFYEDLMMIFNIPQSEDARQQFKKAFFGKIFYSEVHINWEYKTAKDFKNIYPTVYEAVLWYKRNNHADLPIQLQKVEADIVIGEVCNKLIESTKEQELPFFCTVHDCIVCLEQSCNVIQGLLEQHLMQAVGIKPKVKISAF